ncbi:MAG: 23S rRNA (adenine(2503)-C(2))-methyltransferase RlmN [Alphaproteobacteria bacterium]|nr:23S rRNA (adenine(2503)-C(2))-methyltransferase RlmN [Alphaproteobacteria bacterium]
MNDKVNLIGLTRQGLIAALGAAGLPERSLRMRASQIWNAAYVQGLTDFSGITTLAKDARATLAQHLEIARPEVVTEQLSADGTRKWLLRFGPGIEVETVFIPEEDRGTLCISSQVGCTLTCRFCHTGTQKLVRNLTAGEIVAQVMIAKDALREWPRAGRNADTRAITNIVMMGMGEPLYNFENVRDAILILADGEGLSLSKRRITLSTAGVVPMIARAGEEIGSMLAISLHAVRDEIRDVIVPLNKKYPIRELVAAVRAYPGLSNARRVTWEYVMLKGVNDSNADAKELVRLIQGIPSKINLIPFNPWPGAPYACSDWERIEEFAEIVNRAGYASPIRTPRGRDIMAACGQLKSESIKLRAKERLADEAGAG